MERGPFLSPEATDRRIDGSTDRQRAGMLRACSLGPGADNKDAASKGGRGAPQAEGDAAEEAAVEADADISWAGGGAESWRGLVGSPISAGERSGGSGARRLRFRFEQ